MLHQSKLVLYRSGPGASTPLTGGGKCLLEKVGKSKEIENWREYFLVADFLETHNTECDNSAYNSSKTNFWLASLADYW